jgi:hypothetical protein
MRLRTRQWDIAGFDGSALGNALFSPFFDEVERRKIKSLFNAEAKGVDGLTLIFLKI